MALADVASAGDTGLFTEARPMLVQSLLRHAMAEVISEGFINCLIVTSMADANVQLTRIHEHIFARECSVMLLTIAFRISVPTPHPFLLLLLLLPLGGVFVPHIAEKHKCL
jgi:hypothetical protein